MLDHLKKGAAELSSPVEDWAYVFKDEALKTVAKLTPITKEIEDIERIADRNPGVREFIERIDVKNLPAEVRDRYVRHIRYYNDTIVDIEEKATERGIAIGIKQAIDNEAKKCVLQGARVLKKLGIPDHTIAEELGLNQQEMESLKRPVD
jgi:hypothetical protein